MSEWNEDVIRNKPSIVLWGSITAIAIMRYLLVSICRGAQRQDEAPLGQEASEAQSRNKAAEERLINLLGETTRVRHIDMFGT
jgi:hypothetical protein